MFYTCDESFKREELNIKFLKGLSRTWQPKSIAILESKDLTKMTVVTVFGKLKEYGLELGRLKDDEEEGISSKSKYFT